MAIMVGFVDFILRFAIYRIRREMHHEGSLNFFRQARSKERQGEDAGNAEPNDGGWAARDNPTLW